MRVCMCVCVCDRQRERVRECVREENQETILKKTNKQAVSLVDKQPFIVLCARWSTCPQCLMDSQILPAISLQPDTFCQQMQTFSMIILLLNPVTGQSFITPCGY